MAGRLYGVNEIAASPRFPPPPFGPHGPDNGRPRKADRMTERASPTVDPDEVARFERIAGAWWDPDGPMRALHRLNPVRLAHTRAPACRRCARDPRRPHPLEALRALDVGCGGGVLSEPLARLGAAVTGLRPPPAHRAAPTPPPPGGRP